MVFTLFNDGDGGIIYVKDYHDNMVIDQWYVHALRYVLLNVLPFHSFMSLLNRYGMLQELLSNL